MYTELNSNMPTRGNISLVGKFSFSKSDTSCDFLRRVEKFSIDCCYSRVRSYNAHTSNWFAIPWLSWCSLFCKEDNNKGKVYKSPEGAIGQSYINMSIYNPSILWLLLTMHMEINTYHKPYTINACTKFFWESLTMLKISMWLYTLHTGCHHGRFQWGTQGTCIPPPLESLYLRGVFHVLYIPLPFVIKSILLCTPPTFHN